MKRPRIVLAALLAAGGCAFSRGSASISDAGAALDRNVAATEAIDRWEPLPAAAARRLTSEYGIPDEVTKTSLSWSNIGPWRRIVVRDVPPPAVPGTDAGIIEQAVGYSMTPAQSADLAAFDARLAFNPRSQELSARSDREELNFLRLNLADDVVHQRLSPVQARKSYYREVEFDAAGMSEPQLHALLLTP
ncbi:MAG: hypothetical protein HKL90_02260 [Elusimicrobia bacterium]|nr:hypothetical protein [Elusimicrobiota bacterium]